jgi:hypothetical protein
MNFQMEPRSYIKAVKSLHTIRKGKFSDETYQCAKTKSINDVTLNLRIGSPFYSRVTLSCAEKYFALSSQNSCLLPSMPKTNETTWKEQDLDYFNRFMNYQLANASVIISTSYTRHYYVNSIIYFLLYFVRKKPSKFTFNFAI